MNDLDNELTRTMRRHAEKLSAAPLAFDDVRGKATSIRRRRRVATGLAAAAAVAVIVPTAMFASQSLQADNEIPPATTTPTVVDSNGPTPTEGPTTGEDSSALDVADLPTGAEPGLSLVTDGDLAMTQADGAVVRSTQDGVVVEADGQTYGPYPTSHGIVSNQAATAVAWTTDTGQVMAWAKGAGAPFVVAEDLGLEDVRVGAISGFSCSPTDEPSDCVFYVSGYDMATNTSQGFTLDVDGTVGKIDPDGTLLNVRDATDDGRVLGHTEISDFDSCSAVIDRDTGSKPVWKTCQYTLDAFSPDGGLVLGSESYHDGIGSGRIAIFDATTGELLADRSRTEGDMAFYNSAVWEDESHVLFSAYQDGKWSIVRMDASGAMEYAVPPQAGDEMNVPWHFETR